MGCSEAKPTTSSSPNSSYVDQDVHVESVTIKNKDYPFLQSLSGALGFNDPTPTDTRLYEYLLKKTRNRKFYLNASDNYYEFEGVPRCEQEEC